MLIVRKFSEAFRSVTVSAEPLDLDTYLFHKNVTKQQIRRTKRRRIINVDFERHYIHCVNSTYP
jgi:hypothetical protein